MSLIVVLHNLGTHAKHPRFGNYEYQVRVNQDVIAEGRLLDHKRSAGWKKLVQQLLDQEKGVVRD